MAALKNCTARAEGTLLSTKLSDKIYRHEKDHPMDACSIWSERSEFSSSENKSQGCR